MQLLTAVKGSLVEKSSRAGAGEPAGYRLDEPEASAHETRAGLGGTPNGFGHTE